MSFSSFLGKSWSERLWHNAKALPGRLHAWKDGAILDAVWAAGEALLALLFSFLWVFVLVVDYGLSTSGVGLADATRETFAQYFQATDALEYLTAILSSTTAYTLLRLSDVRDYVRRIVITLLITVLLWLAQRLFS